ncbi:MFS transporter [Arsenicicoccus dermatophilus]|uniref:MFS transporter n=1 Tax=Arsenicicoccus dermatophilus TaxID=1076331 RepID=UPI001F4CCF9E|nr:MFS transporter [Arsenicicoccus dermatophilus]MCH8611957.1 MFS transporter [Arsenicicoccus dermatophilus]
MNGSTPSRAAGALTAYDQIDARPLTGHQKSLIGLVVTGNLAEFFDMFLIGFVVSLLTKPWKLTGFEAGTILACSGLGTVVGAILWGRLADRIGRKKAFFWCVVMFVLFTALTLLTPERGWIMLALLRVGVGIGVGGLNITSIPYVQEFVPAKHRGLLAGLGSVFIPAGLFLGSLAQGAVGNDWRVLIGLGCVPVLLLVWLRTVPESPRFYQSVGRDEDARRSLAWALDLPLEQVGALPELPVAAKGASYGVVFRDHLRPLAVVTLGSFCFIMGGFAIQSWGQTLLKSGYGYSVGTVATLFMGVSLVDLLGRLASAWLADVIGRRRTMFLFGLLGAAGCFLAAFAHSSGTVFFIAILIIMAFGDGAFGILNAFGAEQFPNAVRSTGLGLGYGIGATAKIIGPALMGWMIGGNVVKQNVTLDVITPAFSFFGACLLIGAVTYLFARETKGASLDEI